MPHHIEINEPRRGKIVFEKSHLRANAIVLRDAQTGKTINTQNNLEEAMRYARQNGYTR